MLSLSFNQPRRFGPSRSSVMSRHGMVVTSQPLAAEVGVEILRQGGNAVDAAIATAAMLNVLEPMSTGIGGDAFALIFESKTGKVRGLNASGRSASTATLSEYEVRLKDTAVREIPSNSLLAVTVPGTVDGWATALAECGRMSLAQVLAPAIRTAEEGFPVAPQTALTWKEWEHALRPHSDSVRTWLGSVQGAPRPAEIFRCPQLANSLRLIAEGGRDAFYDGPLGKAIVDFSNVNGGLLTKADFQNHKSTWVEPISINYRDYELLEIPPNGQGIAALEALSILAQDDLTAMGHNTPDTIHLQLEAMKCALVDAKQHVTDPVSMKTRVEDLLSIESVNRQRRRISLDRAIASRKAESASQGDTVYLCVADSEGNVVSFINSLFFPWGTGITVGDTGIVLQNRGSGFSLDAAHPNVIAPHKRTRHTIIPAMLLHQGKPLISFGFVGGDVQPQGQVQFLCNVIDFGMNLQDALDAPRWRYEGMGASIALESDVPEEVRHDLSERGHEIGASVGFFGGGQALLIHPEFQTFQAGSDSRRDGCAIGY
jgi:gamma-glutamyltranspeptidase/glutathione hydrolase